MNETIDRIIKRSGEMWEGVRDRKDSPVILCMDIIRGAPVWELSLEEGAHHPYWTVTERTLTNDEWWEFNKYAGAHVGTIIPVTYSRSGYVMANAYVKNGRQPSERGWSYTVEPVMVTVERWADPIESASAALTTFGENLQKALEVS